MFTASIVSCILVTVATTWKEFVNLTLFVVVVVVVVFVVSSIFRHILENA